MLKQAPSIRLFELGPTRSARCRWTLHEAGFEYESLGNAADIIGSEELRKIHPLGKLPAVLIDGRPLFESAAISTAIADLVPEQGLVARPGTWSRALHDQWVCFALTEMEAWLWSTELNSEDFLLPGGQQVPAIIEQNAMLFKRSAAALNAVLGEANYLIENRFTVTDIIVGYTVNFGHEFRLIDEFYNLLAYLERLYQREHCTLVRYG